MGQLLVRNLDEDVKLRLQRRAARNGRSTEEEVRSILRLAAEQEDAPPPAEGIGTRMARRFAGLGLNEETLPEDWPELRGPAHPADFGEK